MDPAPKSTKLKRPCVHEKPASWKKTKATKISEGDLLDINKIVHNVTKDAFEELMTEKTVVLGALRAQLQTLQV